MVKTIRIRKERKSESYVDKDNVVHFNARTGIKNILVSSPILLTLAFGICIVLLAVIIGYIIAFIS
jgi:hypothetical protein